MSRIWSMMDVGKRSMMNSQQGLQTVSHNIANKSTEGYTRQRVEQQANEPVGYGNTRMGQGARITAITRVNNPFIEKQLENEKNHLGKSDAKAETMSRVEEVFNEQTNKGLNKFMSEFFNAFRELSNSPESAAIRSLVKESADFLAKDFQRVDKQLSQIQSESDFQVGVHVNAINEITQEIAVLNKKIQSIEINSSSANDERDRRDVLIKNLGEKINIKYAEGEDGSITITAGNNAILVSGGDSIELTVSDAEADKRDARAQIYYKPSDSSSPINITKQIKGGALGGILEIRDEFIETLKGQLDELAYAVSNEVNSAHRAGFDGQSRPGSNFFKELGAVKNASRNIQVSETIATDPSRIAAGAMPNAPGDNRVANLISSMQYNFTMDEGQSTFDDFYGNVVGIVGVTARRAISESEAQKGIVDQLTNIRESISGVSLDEETTKMIEYQKSYDASARLIRTADEMMDTVLNLKRY